MWTYEDIEGLIANCTVRKSYKDGVHKNYRLIAHEGYAMHMIGDEGFIDEEGNYTPPSYSYQVVMSATSNIYDYEAVLIEEGMEVYDKPSNEETV